MRVKSRLLKPVALRIARNIERWSSDAPAAQDLVFQQLDKQRCIEDQAVKINGYSVNAEWESALLAFSVAGIFVYEWNHWKGPYKRLGIPQMPQRLDELGFLPELRSAFVAIPEPFRNCEELRPELLLPCTD